VTLLLGPPGLPSRSDTTAPARCGSCKLRAPANSGSCRLLSEDVRVPSLFPFPPRLVSSLQGHHYPRHVTGLTPDTVTETRQGRRKTGLGPKKDSTFQPASFRHPRARGDIQRLQAIFGFVTVPENRRPEGFDSNSGSTRWSAFATGWPRRPPIAEWAEALFCPRRPVVRTRTHEEEDETTNRPTRRTRLNRRGTRPPDEVVSFAEYERLSVPHVVG